MSCFIEADFWLRSPGRRYFDSFACPWYYAADPTARPHRQEKNNNMTINRESRRRVRVAEKASSRGRCRGGVCEEVRPRQGASSKKRERFADDASPVAEDASPRTLRRGRVAKDASARTHRRGRVAEDASPKERRGGSVSKEVRPREGRQGRVGEDSSERTRRRGRVGEDASARKRNETKQQSTIGG